MQWGTTRILLKLTVLLVTALTVPFVVLTWMLSSVTGAFIICLFAWGWMYYFGSVKPLTMPQLVLWFDALEDDHKASIFSTIATILGYLAAFWSGYFLWKRQVAADLQLKASEELNDFYSKLLASARTMRRTYEIVIESRLLIRGEIPDTKNRLLVNYRLFSSYQSEFNEAQKTMWWCLQELPALRAKHMLTVSSIPLASRTIRYSDNVVSELEAMSYIPIKGTDLSPEQFVDYTARIWDVDKMIQFVNFMETRSYLILSGPGAMRGGAQQKVFGTPLAMLGSVYHTAGKWLEPDGPIEMIIKHFKARRGHKKPT